MLITTIIGTITLFLAYLANLSKKKFLLVISFSILFIFLAIRFNFGNDYMAYYYRFEDIKNIAWNELFKNIGNDTLNLDSNELGYMILMKFISSFASFYFFIGLQSFLIITIFYKIIKKHVKSSGWWISVFVLIFMPQIILTELSAIRQSFSIVIFLFSIQSLIERKFLKYLTLILIASTFHYSSIVLVLLYFIVNPKKNVSIEKYIYLFIFIFTVFFGKSLLSPLTSIVDLYFPKYNYYIENEQGVKLGSGFGLLINFVLLFFHVFFGNNDSKSNSVFNKLAIIFFVLSPVSLVLNNLSRFALYFSPALVVAIPNFMESKSTPIIKLIYLLLIIFFFLFLFYSFFHSETFKLLYNNYNTIFDYNVRTLR